MRTDLDPPHNHMGWSFSIALDGCEKADGKETFLSPFSMSIRSPQVRHTIDGMEHFPLVTIFFFQLNPDGKW